MCAYYRAFSRVIQYECMGKSEKPIAWLPVDSRLFGSFLSFGHVHGVARIFLVFEMIMAVLIVLGTLVMATMKLFLQ